MVQRFGQYELLEKFAEGGAAEIYFARLVGREGFARELAIKRLLPGYAEQAELVEMFLDEARLAASLLHPNVVQVYDLGELGGTFFMAMELVDGPHLGALFSHSIKINKPLPLEHCAYIMTRAAEGLHYAHERVDPLTGESLGIVHRDMSPHNTLVSRYGDVKVTDFGIARSSQHRAVTRIGIVKGKLGYLSPEQCQGKPFDRRADVFSMGITLYELLTRRRLYREVSQTRAMSRIVHEEPLPPSVLNPEVDPILGEIALRALRKDPDHRYQTAAEFGDALQAWLVARGTGDVRSALAWWMSRHTAGIWTNNDDRSVRWRQQQDKDEAAFRAGSEQETVHAPEPEVPVQEVESLGFRPLRTNLPRTSDSFVGRVRELDALEREFGEGADLVAIVGPAGMGKSRLARQFGHRVVDRYRERGGVWLCDLSDFQNIEGLCMAVASVLGVPLVGGDAEAPEVQLARAISTRGDMLMLLDNFERIEARGLDVVRGWLEGCPALRVLLTSRERPRVSDAQVFELHPLGLPDGEGDPMACEAVQLFVERARAADPDFSPQGEEIEAVVEIARQLDGLPLALELAAARMATMSVADLLSRLTHRFEVLRVGRQTAGVGQSTLRGAIDWSWNMLDPDERSALSQCAVFRGGFDFEAAEEVIEPPDSDGPDAVELVEALLDKSLLTAHQDPGSDGRLRLGMYRSIAAYADEKLSDTLRAAAWERHARYYADVCSAAADAVHGHGGSESMRRLQLESDNLIAVHERALARWPRRARDVDQAVSAALALFPMLLQQGPWKRALALLDGAREAAAETEGVDARLRVRMLTARAHLLAGCGRVGEARSDVEEALVRARRLRDRRLQARAMLRLGRVAFQQDRLEEAHSTASQALELLRREADRRNAGLALEVLGLVELARGEVAEALVRLQQALDTLRSVGDRAAEAGALTEIGVAFAGLGRHEEAEHRLLLALETQRQIRDRRGEGVCLAHLGALQAWRGDLRRARESLLEALSCVRGVGDWRSEAMALSRLALVRLLQGRPRAAREEAELALQLTGEVGDRLLIARCNAHLGAVLAADDKAADASRAFERAMGWLHEGDPAALVDEVQLCIAQHDLALARAEAGASDDEARLGYVRRAYRRVAMALQLEPDGSEGMQSLDARLVRAVWLQAAAMFPEGEEGEPDEVLPPSPPPPPVGGKKRP